MGLNVVTLLIILLGIIGIVAVIACIVAIVLKRIADTHVDGQEDQGSQDNKTGR